MSYILEHNESSYGTGVPMTECLQSANRYSTRYSVPPVSCIKFVEGRSRRPWIDIPNAMKIARRIALLLVEIALSIQRLLVGQIQMQRE